MCVCQNNRYRIRFMTEKKLTDKLFDTICDRLAEGRSLRSICRDDDVPVSESLVRKRVIRNAEWGTRYASARDVGLDAMSDEMLDIAHDGSNDWMTIETDKGNIKEVTNHEHVTRSRLRVDTLKWHLSKLAPKRYGDRITQDVTSSDGSLSGLSKDQVAHKLNAILEAASKRAEAAERSNKGDVDDLIEELV